MPKTLDPTAFARIMALPLAVRQDVLEFIGSTPVSQKHLETLVSAASGRNREGRPA